MIFSKEQMMVRQIARDFARRMAVSTEAAEQICSDAKQTLGGAGYITDFSVERIYRAVRGSKIYEGTNDIQRLVISRALVNAGNQEQQLRSCS